MPKFLYSEKSKQIKVTHTMFIEYQDTSRKEEEVCVSKGERYEEWKKNS